MTKEEGKGLPIFTCSGIESYIKFVEKLAKPRLFFIFFIAVRFKKERAKHRTEGKRINS